jgi:hypothetical protein
MFELARIQVPSASRPVARPSATAPALQRKACCDACAAHEREADREAERTVHLPVQTKSCGPANATANSTRDLDTAIRRFSASCMMEPYCGSLA